MVLAVMVAALLTAGAWLAMRAMSRMATPDGAAARRGPPLMADEMLNHVYPPNVDAPCAEITNIYAIDHRGCRFVTNEHGFKSSHAVPMAKPADTLRIFFVGDSFVEGFCDDRLTMPEQVEARLQAAPAMSGRHIEVVNTGVSSYSTMIYYLLVSQRLIRLAPDLVVINMDLTDVYDDTTYEPLARFDDSGDLVAIGTIGRPTAQRDVAPGDPLVWARPGRLAEVQPAVERSLEWLRRTIRAASASGAHVVVSLTPHLGQLGAAPGGRLSTEPGTLVRSAADEAGALYFDALAALAARSEGQPGRWYLEPGDNHFNIAGNAIWAEVFAEFLLEHADRLLVPAGSD